MTAFGKRGNWYEEDYVLFEALRLLSEHTLSLAWERWHKKEDAKGVDLWIRERDGRRIAIQCKTHSTGHWTPSQLIRERVPQYARTQLERDVDRADLFRFASDAPAPDWQELIRLARHDESDWLNAANDGCTLIEKGLGLRVDGEDVDRARHLLRRMEVDVVSAAPLKRNLLGVARLLVGADAERLISSLRDILRGEHELGREWSAHELRSALEPTNPSWAGHRLAPRFHDHLQTLYDEFREEVKSRRWLRSTIERAEADEVIDELADRDGDGRTVLVHGPPGSGKSEVLLAVIDRLRGDAVAVLPLIAGSVENGGLGDDPALSLRQHAGTSRAVLVIDQFDQLATTADGQGRLSKVLRWIGSARRHGLEVVVGCRTVDAQHGDRLTSLFRDPDALPVEVGDLPEEHVLAALNDVGIPIDDLPPEIRRLSRRAVALKMISNVASVGWRAQSVYDIARQWLRVMMESADGDAEAVIDELLRRAQHDGTPWVDRSLLPAGPALERLITLRVLAAVGHKVGFAHQVLGDARLAEPLIAAATAGEFLSQVGHRAQQDLHVARRVRLAAPGIASRANMGASLLASLLGGDELRPIIKRALLLGLADVDMPDPALVRIVRGWLDDPGLRDSVAWTLLRSQVAWFDALRDWLDVSWTSCPSERRTLLLELLASVSRKRGSEVAQILARWSEHDVEAVARAHDVFWSDPSGDAQELFEQRLVHDHRTPDHFPVDWDRLAETHPERALRLFAVRLEHVTDTDLIEGRSIDNIPTWPEHLPEPMINLGSTVWDALRDRWLRLEVEDLRTISTYVKDSQILVAVVTLLARSLARALHRGQRGVAEILGELPWPNRPADDWLVLQLGAHLEAGTDPQVADELMSWFCSQPSRARLRVGYNRSRLDYDLAAGFLDTVGQIASTRSLRLIERHLLRFPGEWSADHERARFEFLQRGGNAPTMVGVTAWLLLPHLPAGRLSQDGRRHLEQLKRKFDSYAEFLVGFPPLGGTRSVESPVPTHVADRWDDEDWITHLSSAPPFLEGGESHYAIETLTHQVESLVRRDPRGRLGLARRLAEDEATPVRARAVVLRALAHPANADDALDGAELEEMLLLPGYLDHDECADVVVDSVAERAEHAWTDVVLQRLRDLAETPDGAWEGTPKALGSFRLNNTACGAVRALALVARSHADRRALVLDIAEGLTTHAHIGRRASAGYAAMCCYDHDSVRALRVLFEVASDPVIAAEPDIGYSLRFTAIDERVLDRDREVAKQLLLALISDERHSIAEAGGGSVLVLRRHDRITHGELLDHLGRNPIARRTCAQILAHWLGEPPLTDWTRQLTLLLANDEDESIGDAMLLGALQHADPELIESDVAPGFAADLSRTRAARRHVRKMLRFLDRYGSLLPLADDVLDLCRSVDAPIGGSPTWKQRTDAEAACGMLDRLVVEAEQKQNLEVKAQALDAWDCLLESGTLAAHRTLAFRSHGDDAGDPDRA